MRALPLNQLMEIVDRINQMGVKRVVLTGGEPLLTPGIQDILKKLHGLNIEIALSTNGSFVEHYWSIITQFVSSLNIPLDGPTPEVHALSRADTSTFYTNMAILKRYRESLECRPLKLRIGMVYSKATRGQMQAIARLLLPFADCITTWKVYELIDHESQRELRAPLIHDTGDFTREIALLYEDHSLEPIVMKMMTASAESRDRAYFMLNPLGQVVVPTRISNVTVEKVIGHFLEDSIDDLASRWEIAVNLSNYQVNHRAHYEKS